MLRSSLVGLYYFVLLCLTQTSSTYGLPFISDAPMNAGRRSYEIPFVRRSVSHVKRQGTISGESGLGDNNDLLYTVPVELGSITTAVHLDTGSADLWVITDECTTEECGQATATRYPSSSLNSTGTQVTMRYGDSTTGTSASGVVAFDTATIAGVAINDQSFVAVDRTDNPTVKYAAAGILGLGFPSGSETQEAVVIDKSGPIQATDDFVSSTYADGPLLARIAMTNALELPMFSISLQRNTIDIGGGTGMLTIGRLPEGVDNSSLTWVPVRMYRPQEGGLRPPSFAPDEVYPFRWEIDIEGVFLNGERLPDSTEPAEGGVDSNRVSALIDTGNSLLRGPSDVVDNILSRVSASFNPDIESSAPTFPCATPHTLEFQIGGKRFPIDPRDFIGHTAPGDATTCIADNLVATDPPSVGALFRWSLGDPFFKSNIVAFHYGNLTHPSVDPPRVGLLSIVPENSDEALRQAVQDAVDNGGNFESTLEVAPTASAAAEGQVTVFPTLLTWTSAPGTAGTAGATSPTSVNNAQATSSSSPSSDSQEGEDEEDEEDGVSGLRVSTVAVLIVCSLSTLLSL